ncbi:NfeD family protein [Niveispirillum irakense]|uniref:NfeD family protein n=1 Tax=Niveispirillum irakense TaxID=34011 RepID=UPI0004152ECE|nr:NfeD family protein [Niveispirillum irakense]
MIFWYWWCLALALAALEMFIPGAAFLWVAGAAALTGIIAWVLPDMALAVELVLFGVLAALAYALSRRFMPRGREDGPASTLNRRAEQYVGHIFTLETALSGGRGRVHVGDTLWPVTAEEDLPAGAKVRVVAVDGALMRVTAAPAAGISPPGP